MSVITHNLLKTIIFDQKEEEIFPLDYIQRTSEPQLVEFSKNKEIIVLKGLRRAGKSVLLNFIRRHSSESDYYFNFEDERLVMFTLEHFYILQEVFIELFGPQKTYFFDEIQNIEGWEMFVRRLYNNGNKVYISGSNANLFSEELGTRLTGRYIALSIYPISFQEYTYHKISKPFDVKKMSTAKTGELKRLFSDYFKGGGIPEYIKTQHIDYLHALYNSIIYRDIIARYKLPSDLVVKKLLFFLASNCSKETTFNSLRKMLGVGSATTISTYCHYLENSYLCFFVNRYSDSIKSQMQSPKKVYFIDHIIAKTIGFRMSEDYGRALENIVFLELKRNRYEIFYHKASKECDFIVRQEGRTVQAIQVCKEMTDKKVQEREMDGLIEAMNRFSLTEGLIITENEDFQLTRESEGRMLNIKIVPIWKWLLGKK